MRVPGILGHSCVRETCLEVVGHVQIIIPHMEWISTPETIQSIVEIARKIVWNIEWKNLTIEGSAIPYSKSCRSRFNAHFSAQLNPMYTALNAIVLADEKIKNASLALSALECQVCVFCRYWKESTLKNSSAIDKSNIIPKNTLNIMS
jgi:hypothetical protein